MYRTSEYHRWKQMKQRCLNPASANYHNYGGRGIAICKRWVDSFENFLDDMGGCPHGLTLERIDNNGNYEPSNCKWDTWKHQQNNKRERKATVIARPLSRQRLYQIRQQSQNRCIYCGSHVNLYSGVCDGHYLARKLKRKRKSFPSEIYTASNP